MRSKLSLVWAAIRDSLWFVPAVMTIVASVAALLLVHAERTGLIDLGYEHQLAFAGTADGARSLLSAVAGALMTVTGVAFSVTVVALQLSSSQFSPRILPNFMADRANQFVLGVLIGTFTYSLLVLRVIDGGSGDTPQFVPRVSVTVAIALALASVAMVIFFINHAARSIQISVILQRTSQRALEHVDRLFPEEFGEPDPGGPDEQQVPPDAVAIRAPRSGYLQAIDDGGVFDLCKSAEAVIAFEHRIGSFVLEGEPLARVWPPTAASDELREKLARAFILGHERTLEQDFELALIEISDIAVKALSPSINDPTTAQHCIDRLSQLLLALARHHAPTTMRTDEGRVHVIVRDLPFDRALESALGPVVHFGKSNPAIRDRLLARLDTLIDLVPEARRPPLIEMRSVVREKFTDEDEALPL